MSQSHAMRHVNLFVRTYASEASEPARSLDRKALSLQSTPGEDAMC